MTRLRAASALWLAGAGFVTTVAEPAVRLPASSAGDVKVFVNARLWDGSGRARIEDATVIVRDGRIVAVGPAKAVALPAGVPPLDLRDRFVTPGLVNAHGHVGETRGLAAGPELYSRENVLDQLRLYARYGVTAVLSLGGDQAEGFRIRAEQSVPGLDRARLYAAGRVVDAKTPAEAVPQVAAVAAFAPDFVKIRVDDNLGTTPKMTPETYRAVIDEAHRRKLRVAAHLFSHADAEDLLAAGVDFIAHSVRDRDVTPALVRSLRERRVCVCPTLVRELQAFVYGSEPEFFADPLFLREADPKIMSALRDPARQESVRKSPAAARYTEALEVASRNLKTLAEAGVPLAFGTDSGPPARFQGYFEHLELRLMVKAGLTPEQALLSATSVAARCLGLEGQVGTLVPGAWADFAVFEKNPLDDIRNTETLKAVYVAGNRVPPFPGVPKLQLAWSKNGPWGGVAAQLGSPIIYGTRSNTLVSLNLNDGHLIELAPSDGPRLRLAAHQGQPMILSFSTWGGSVSAHSSTGDLFWKHETTDGIDDVWPADLNGDGQTGVVVGLNGKGGVELLGPDGQPRWHDTSIGNVWSVTAGRLADKALHVLTTSSSGQVHVFSGEGRRVEDMDVRCYARVIRVAARPYLGCTRDQGDYVATLDPGGWMTKVSGQEVDGHSLVAVEGVPWIAVSMSSDAVYVLGASTGIMEGYALEHGPYPELAWAGTATSPLLLVASDVGLRAYRVRPRS
jgi:imidazolonepropionase-like amidohydrolase